jgi:inhibitor of cysteine peptidase
VLYLVTEQASRELGEGDNDRMVGLAPGESFDVVLPENATTGFRWSLERSAEPVVRLLVDTVIAAEGGGIGAGGGRRFRFVADRPGEASLSLMHWRPWEGEGSVTKRYGIRVRVRAAGS